jgi:purine nucleoside permease
MNADGELAIVTGQGTAHAAATIMALGLDPRFDLSHAYWLIAGIAGGNPERVSLGSAAWANYVVDSDLSYEIDPREIPSGWTTGKLPLRKGKPFETPATPLEGQLFQTNPALTEWAYNLTSHIPLADTEKLKDARSRFPGEIARKPPQVLLGDEISGSAYWHGKLMNDWADRWMDYFTNNQGKFATTAMEDTGSLLSLQYLAKAGKADANRVLVLRAVSNYDQQWPGVDAAASLSAQRIGQYSAYLPALESAYKVGHTVVAELIQNWPKYRDQPPSPQK